MTATLYGGDLRHVLPALADNSVDAVVTDPPYDLTSARPGGRSEATRGAVMGGFMGMAWDSTGVAFDSATWREVLRVMKPGAHLLAFGGTRTHHRMMCAIEDAGFELRDTLMYVYGSGFPKSLNLDREKGNVFCGCESPAQCEVRRMRDGDVSAAVAACEAEGEILQPRLPQQGLPVDEMQCTAPSKGSGQPRLEGWHHAEAAQGQLLGDTLCEGASVGGADGEERRVHHGAPPSNGGMDRPIDGSRGSGESSEPPPEPEQPSEPRALAGQRESQTWGGWEICRRCGKPVVASGLGTQLKPAWEPVVLARKPLDGTVANNVKRWGTGALNIDACRIHSFGENLGGGRISSKTDGWDRPWKHDADKIAAAHARGAAQVRKSEGLGRWPANVMHDGSPEVVALFPADAGAAAPVRGTEPTANGFSGAVEYSGMRARVPGAFHGDGGSAARFFYSPKADREDRNDGVHAGADPAVGAGATMREREVADWPKRNGNFHPTVKPTDLMRYLVRLVTPPGALVLDPFMGSGSTGRAALLERCKFVGCELYLEYLRIAEQRINAIEPLFTRCTVHDAGALRLPK